MGRPLAVRAGQRASGVAPWGFTLIELLVALGILSLMAIMSWRGLDGMTRVQAQTHAHADELFALQAGLSQWGSDLDGIVQANLGTPAIEWDGAVMRMTRRNTSDPAAGIWVVAWARKETPSGPQWMRWQSPALQTRGAVSQAWDQAQAWARGNEPAQDQRQVPVAALAQWQIYYYLGSAWSNPLSANNAAVVPEGVRLVLTLPTGGALSGVITRDWVRPDVGGGKT